jgi:hypothetical protein
MTLDDAKRCGRHCSSSLFAGAALKSSGKLSTPRDQESFVHVLFSFRKGAQVQVVVEFEI